MSLLIFFLLDHCMRLREQAGGDKNLFSVERKLKRLQRKQEKQNQRVYERQSQKRDVFDFMNNTLSTKKEEETKDDRQMLKKESHRSLNIQTVKFSSCIKGLEDNILTLRESLKRHADKSSNSHQLISTKIAEQEDQLKMIQRRMQMVKNELDLRRDRKKLTEF